MTSAERSPSSAAGAQTFTDILVVCTHDETDRRTLALAADLARGHGASLTVLGVTDQGTEIERLAHYRQISSDEVRDSLAAETRDRLIAHAEDVAEGLSVTIDVRIGKPFLEIIHRVLDFGHDLVIKAAEDFEGMRRYLFASTDQHLLRKCPCPVWLTMPDQRRPARTVLAAIDIDEFAASEPAALTALNDRIVETAARIALFEGAELHVIHVWEAAAEGLVRRWSTTDESVLSYVREVEMRHRAALNAVADRARAKFAGDAAARLPLIQHLARGIPRAIIPERARALGADILVMGTIARTGIPGVIIGNTAEDVLNSVDCSVLTVKPPGYVSPVEAARA